MAIDYGDARTGVACSDLGRVLCGEAFTISERNRNRLLERILQEIQDRDVDTVVIGLPRNMDGSEGAQAEQTRAFASALAERSGLRPIFWDERYSSVEAHAILHANGRREKKHRKTVDAVAASLMLESYLRTSGS